MARNIIVSAAELALRQAPLQFFRGYFSLPTKAQIWIAGRMRQHRALNPHQNPLTINFPLFSGKSLLVSARPDGVVIGRNLLFGYPCVDIGVKASFAALAKHAPSPHIFLDVGFNIGFMAIEVLAEARHEVIGFEANSELQAESEILFSELGLPKPFVNYAAVTDGDGETLTFYISSSSYLSSLNEAHAAKEGSVKQISVPTLTLDRYTLNFTRKVALIKIDVEGAEAAVLRGARSIIKRDQPAVLFECFKEQRETLWGELTALGLVIYGTQRKVQQQNLSQFIGEKDDNFVAVFQQTWQAQALELA